MDEKWKDNIERIIHMHIADFLLADWLEIKKRPGHL